MSEQYPQLGITKNNFVNVFYYDSDQMLGSILTKFGTQAFGYKLLVKFVNPLSAKGQ